MALLPELDPGRPSEHSFTTEKATLPQGWYRISFVDESGDESVATPVVFNRTDPRRPSVDDVALLLRTRTVGAGPGGSLIGGDTGPVELTTFTAETRPTATEVEAMIDVASDEVLAQLPAEIASSFHAIRRSIALRAAVLIEASFFRESADASLAAASVSSLEALGRTIPRVAYIA
jgi:hypothetical protein